MKSVYEALRQCGLLCKMSLAVILCLCLSSYAATLNISDYGAVPDDAGDDRTAINSAILAASPNDTVFFPAGTYHVSGSITGKTGVRLEGASGAVLLYVGTSADIILSLNAMSNVTVTGLTLDGNNSALVTQGIQASNGSGIRLENLTIQNIGNISTWGPHGILFSPSVTDSTITNNTITNIGTGTAWGAGIRLAHGSSRNRVENNTIADTGRGGILCNDNSTDAVICNNTVTGSGGDGLGIELWVDCHRGLVEDNTVDHWISIAFVDYCAVRRNTISDKSGVYKFIGIEGISQNSIYTDNLVDDGSHLGISLSGDVAKDYAIWARNTINKSSTWGVQFQGENVGCAYHYFYQNKFLNTNRDQPPALYAYQGYGFRFNGNCHYISFEENEFSNNEGGGFQLLGNINQISFVNNRITDNAGYSIVDGFGSDVEWEGNIVSGNGVNNTITSRGFSSTKPVAAFTSSSTALTGQAVSFTNTSYDPDGSIEYVLWDFGDGLPSTDFNPTHIYTKPGNYTVSLVVWDNAGRGKLANETLCLRSPDLTADGTIDELDLIRLAQEWLWTESLGTPSNMADLDCDGLINLSDLAVFASEWQ